MNKYKIKYVLTGWGAWFEAVDEDAVSADSLEQAISKIKNDKDGYEAMITEIIEEEN